MDENENLSKAFDKLGEMLSSEDGQKQISDILSMFTGQEQKSEEAPPQNAETNSGAPDSGFSFQDFDMLNTAKKLLSTSGSIGKQNKNAAFLEALKPFLRKERRDKLDSAVKLINAAAIFKEMGVLKKGGD